MDIFFKVNLKHTSVKCFYSFHTKIWFKLNMKDQFVFILIKQNFSNSGRFFRLCLSIM